MDWDKHAHHWPMAEHSRFVRSRPHLWHVQEAGSGPVLLLLHGAGGATQSWRHLFPLLAKSHHVIGLDLPGQGFTKMGTPGRCGLTAMATDIAALCQSEGWEPTAIIGHSAGGAIALEMVRLSQDPRPKVIGLNAALDTFHGVAGFLYPVMAKALARLPFVADVFAMGAARPDAVKKLIEGTGSVLSDADITFYHALIRDSGHVKGTLQMMAQWELSGLIAGLDKIENEVVLLCGDQDKMVPPATASKSAALLPAGSRQIFPDVGHLMHEERPDVIARAIADALRQNAHAAQ